MTEHDTARPPHVQAFEFVIPGHAVPFTRVGRNPSTGRTYTPTHYAKYKGLAGRSAALALMARHMLGTWPLDARYRVSIRVYLGARVTSDVDNLGKAILDGCNGVAWEDDRQIDDLHVVREFGHENERAEVHVEVIPPPEPRPGRKRHRTRLHRK